MRKLLVSAVVMLGLAAAQQAEVRVAVAANLRDAFIEIVRAFNQDNTNIKVTPSFGSSGGFVQQITQGAPFDVFMAADTSFPQALERNNLTEPGTLRVYAKGRLALLIPNRVGLSPSSLNILLDPKIARIAIANPETAPYGRTAIEALQRAGLLEKLRSKLVFGQDISQATQLILAAADAGFTAYSLTFTTSVKGQGKVWVVPERLAPPLEQAYVIIKGRNRPEVKALYDYIQGDKARTILKAFGYQVP